MTCMPATSAGMPVVRRFDPTGTRVNTTASQIRRHCRAYRQPIPLPTLPRLQGRVGRGRLLNHRRALPLRPRLRPKLRHHSRLLGRHPTLLRKRRRVGRGGRRSLHQQPPSSIRTRSPPLRPHLHLANATMSSRPAGRSCGHRRRAESKWQAVLTAGRKAITSAGRALRTRLSAAAPPVPSTGR